MKWDGLGVGEDLGGTGGGEYMIKCVVCMKKTK